MLAVCQGFVSVASTLRFSTSLLKSVQEHDLILQVTDEFPLEGALCLNDQACWILEAKLRPEKRRLDVAILMQVKSKGELFQPQKKKQQH